jgi:hypothetical protein
MVYVFAAANIDIPHWWPRRSMETAHSSPPAEVSRVAMRLPPIWAKQPAVWFAQVEAQVFLAGVSSNKSKFFNVISQLDHRYVAEVEDMITSRPEGYPYTTLRTDLVWRLSPWREQRIGQLLTIEMGDRKPSQFLKHHRGLAPDVAEDFLYTIWSSRLRPNIQAIPPVSMSVACSPQPAVRTASPRFHLSRRLLSLVHTSTTRHFCRRLRTSPARWRHSAPSRTASTPLLGTLPWAPGTLIPAPEIPAPGSGIADRTAEPLPRWQRTHPLLVPSPLRKQSAKVYSALRLPPAGKLTQQTSPAANVCSTTGRLFVTDRSSKRQFLFDTCSDLCVYRRRLAPQRKERANYDFCVANGTTIHIYGWLCLSLNLGLCRDFTWSFVVADGTHPNIGVNFFPISASWWTAETTG